MKLRQVEPQKFGVVPNFYRYIFIYIYVIVYVSMLVWYEAGDESGRFRVPRKLKSTHHDIKMRYFLYSTRKDLTSSIFIPKRNKSSQSMPKTSPFVVADFTPLFFFAWSKLATQSEAPSPTKSDLIAKRQSTKSGNFAFMLFKFFK